MEISLTLFNSIFDNKTTQRLTFKNFDSFEKALYGLSKRKLKSKKDYLSLLFVGVLLGSHWVAYFYSVQI